MFKACFVEGNLPDTRDGGEAFIQPVRTPVSSTDSVASLRYHTSRWYHLFPHPYVARSLKKMKQGEQKLLCFSFIFIGKFPLYSLPFYLSCFFNFMLASESV